VGKGLGKSSTGDAVVLLPALGKAEVKNAGEVDSEEGRSSELISTSRNSGAGASESTLTCYARRETVSPGKEGDGRARSNTLVETCRSSVDFLLVAVVGKVCMSVSGSVGGKVGGGGKNERGF
jgi:hypothetical protein